MLDTVKLNVEKTPVHQSRTDQAASADPWTGTGLKLGMTPSMGFDLRELNMTPVVREGFLVKKGVSVAPSDSERPNNVVTFFQNGFHAMGLASAA